MLQWLVEPTAMQEGGSDGSAFDIASRIRRRSSGDGHRPSVGLSRLAAQNRSSPHAIGTHGVTDYTHDADTVANPLSVSVAGRAANNPWLSREKPAPSSHADGVAAAPATLAARAESQAREAERAADPELMMTKKRPQEDPGYDTVQQQRLNEWRDFFEEPDSSVGAKVLSLVILGLICVSTLGLVIETIPTFDNVGDKQNFFVIECCCIFLFTVEYITRLLLSEERREFVQQGMNVIDLVSIVPFYFDLLIWGITLTAPYESSGGASDLTRVLRLFRLVRVFRVFKLGRNSKSLFIAFRSVIASLDTLGLMVFILLIMLVLFGAFVFSFEVGDWEPACSVLGSDSSEGCYKVENELGIVTISLFISVPEAMWWCVVTVMTVGYGEVLPLTAMGKMISCCCMVSSIVILALPISVIGINFSAMWADDENSTMMKGDAWKLFACGETLDKELAEFLGSSKFYIDRLAAVHDSIRQRVPKILELLCQMKAGSSQGESDALESPGESDSLEAARENEARFSQTNLGNAVLHHADDPVQRALATNRLVALKMDEVYMRASYERLMTFFPLIRLNVGEDPKAPRVEPGGVGIKRSLLRTKLNGQMVLKLAQEVRLVEAELAAMKQFVSCEDLPEAPVLTDDGNLTASLR